MEGYVDSILGTARSEPPESDSNHDGEQYTGDKENEDNESEQRKRARLDTPPLTRPSEYLRSRCPLCFGGKTVLHRE